LADYLEASLACLKLPPVHRKAVRITNLVERSFVEERRRAKELPRFWSEGAFTKLVHARGLVAGERALAPSHRQRTRTPADNSI